MARRVLFAGGCHLTGYLAGADFAFPRVAAEILSRRGVFIESELVTHVALHRPERVIAKLHDWNPDLLVLQVGHFETQKTFGQWLRGERRRKKSGRGASKPTSGSEDPPKFGGYSRKGVVYRVWVAGKRILDRALDHPLVDFPEFGTKLSSFCHTIRKAFAGPAILMSPLPCADPVVGFYRDRACLFYRRAANECGFDFLDCRHLHPPPEDHVFDAAHYFADPVHLGRVGHRDVGEHLAQAMENKWWTVGSENGRPFPTIITDFVESR